jgi:glycosyltransferase involved in cell wall biosynthesis
VALVTFPYAATAGSGRGVDRYSLELLNGLRRRGIDVAVLGETGRAPSLDSLVRPLLGLFRATLRTHGRVFHAVDPLGGAVVALTGRRPLILTMHDSLFFATPHLLDPHPLRLRFYGMRVLSRFAMAVATSIVVPFESTRRELSALQPTCAKKIRIVPYGLSLPGTAGRVRSLEPPTQSPGGPFRMLFIGGAQPYPRGGSVALRALKVLRDRGIAAHLDFVVLGPDAPALASEAKSLGVADAVSFLSPLAEAELLSRISEHDVFVYPAILGFSFLVLQAMAAGVPVVTGADRDLPEFVGSAGFTCPRGDIEGLARLLEQLASDSALRLRTAEAGLVRALEFGPARMIDALASEYSRLSPTGQGSGDQNP